MLKDGHRKKVKKRGRENKELDCGETGKWEKRKGHQVRDIIWGQRFLSALPYPCDLDSFPHPVQGHARNTTAPFPDDPSKAPTKTR